MERDTTEINSQRDLVNLKNPNSSAARHMGAGFAKKAELAEYLKVSSRNVTSIALSISLKPNRVGRFTWNDIWWRLWQIKSVPPQLFEEMKRPLLTNAELGVMLGMHERSIRRDGDRQDQLHDLPDHLDLSERIRRHHPVRIQYWSQGMPLPIWLRPSLSVRKLVLIGASP